MTFLSSPVLWHLSPDGYLLVDARGVICATNEAMDTMFGVLAGEPLVGHPVEQLLPDAHRSAHIGLRNTYLDRPRSRSMGDSRPLLARHRSGATFPVAVSLTPLDIGGDPFVFAAVRDLTERVQIQSALDEARQRRDRAEDGERIATELHDNVIQRLFVLGLELQQLDPLFADSTARERVGEAIDTIDETIREIRNTISALTAPRPPSVGLRGEVKEIVAQLEGRLGIAPTITFEGDVDRYDTSSYGEFIRTVLDGTVDLIAPHPATGTIAIRVEGGDALLLEVNASGSERPAGRLLTELRHLRASRTETDVELGHANGITTVQWILAPA